MNKKCACIVLVYDYNYKSRQFFTQAVMEIYYWDYTTYLFKVLQSTLSVLTVPFSKTTLSPLLGGIGVSKQIKLYYKKTGFFKYVEVYDIIFNYGKYFHFISVCFVTHGWS